MLVVSPIPHWHGNIYPVCLTSLPSSIIFKPQLKQSVYYLSEQRTPLIVFIISDAGWLPKMADIEVDNK